MLARLTCVALLLVALATAYDASQDDVVTLLQDEKVYDPSIQREHLADVNKIQDVPVDANVHHQAHEGCGETRTGEKLQW